ncbi:MAG: condensation domain-containing protein, partial [Rhabdochlamydiaceae bacterium]
MNYMSKDIKNLSQKQRILLEQRLQEKKKQSQLYVTIPKRKSVVAPLLSFEQQQLWFLDQLYPQSALYNIPMSFRLSGSLDVIALERSLRTIVERHEILRTTFQFVAGQLVQVIEPQFHLNLVLIDLRTLPNAMREAIVPQIVSKEATTPFNLSTGPLIRLRLLLIDENEYIFLLSLHHVIS